VCMVAGVISVVLTAAITATSLQKLSLMPYESRMVEFLEHATTANTLRKHAARIIQAAWRFRKKVKRNNELPPQERDSIFLERRRLTDAITLFSHHKNTVQAYDRRYRNDQLVRSMLEDITRQCEEAKIYYSAASQIAAATGQALEVSEQRSGRKNIVETEYKIINARKRGEMAKSSVLKKANSLAGKNNDSALISLVNQNQLETVARRSLKPTKSDAKQMQINRAKVDTAAPAALSQPGNVIKPVGKGTRDISGDALDALMARLGSIENKIEADIQQRASQRASMVFTASDLEAMAAAQKSSSASASRMKRSAPRQNNR